MKKEPAKPPHGSTCEERHPSSRDDYIPCGKPADFIVRHKGKVEERAGYFMCQECMNKAVRAGGKVILRGEAYVPLHPPRNAKEPEELLDDVEEAPIEIDDAKVKKISALASQQLDLIERIKAKEEELKALQLALKTNMEADLPNAMSECGVENFTLTGGASVAIEKIVRASIPKTHLNEGLAFMRDKAPDLVKHTITIQFDRKDQKFFAKFMRDLAQRKRPVDASIKDSVHAGTLSAYVRRCDEEGVALPEDILGIFRTTAAKVTPGDKT